MSPFSIRLPQLHRGFSAVQKSMVERRRNTTKGCATNDEYPPPRNTACSPRPDAETRVFLIDVSLPTLLSRQAFNLDFPPGVTVGGVESDDLTNGEQNAPSIFSSAGLSVGAFLKSPYESHPAGSNSSAPDIQVCAWHKSHPTRVCFF